MKPEFSKHKKKHKKIQKRLLLMLNGVLLLALVVSSIHLIITYTSYQRSAKAYQSLNEAALSTPTPSPASQVDDASPSPEVQIEVPVTINWTTLRDQNEEIVAWLYCQDTPINYPVTQSDNNSYYLTHNASKQKDEAGSLFLDCRNDIGPGAANIIIYGHRRNDRSMFGSLVKFSDQKYLAKHPNMFLLTPEHSYLVELFACRTVHGTEKNFETQFDQETRFLSYVNKAINQSYWPTQIQISAEDTILTLATCSRYDGADGARLLLHGKLVPID